MSEKTKYTPIDKPTRQLRWLVMLYVVLLVLEGVLRKWIFPGLSDILLLVRDPIVLLAYAIAIIHNKFPVNRYVISGFALMLLWCVETQLMGHGNLLVNGFGFRANYFHIPFAFIMGSVLYRSDLIVLGKWWLLGTLIMTAIIILQFNSPQSAWINRSTGGLEGGGFSGAMGKYRPPGTFSFIVGVVWFYTFSMAFLISGMTQHNRYPKWLLGAGATAVLLAIPISISRSLLLAVGLTFTVGILTTAFQKNTLLRYLRVALFLCLALFAVNQLFIFDNAKDAFLSRWETSTGFDRGGIKHTIAGRIINEFTGPFSGNTELLFFGTGIGAGTQAGTKILTGQRGFSLGEGEWYRLTGEGGIIFGGLFILWRIWLTYKLSVYAFIKLKNGNGMGLIFLSAVAFNLLIGALGQTTIHGFTIMGIGLTIAAMRSRTTITLATNDTSIEAS
jgi:hypothetical protein